MRRPKPPAPADWYTEMPPELRQFDPSDWFGPQHVLRRPDPVTGRPGEVRLRPGESAEDAYLRCALEVRPLWRAAVDAWLKARGLTFHDLVRRVADPR